MIFKSTFNSNQHNNKLLLQYNIFIPIEEEKVIASLVRFYESIFYTGIGT